MKSIQTKFILLILVGIGISTIIIGGIGTYSFKDAIDESTVQIMNWTCGEKAQELNTVFGRIEQSVHILAEYAVSNLDSVDKLSNDTAYLEEYTEKVADLGMMIVNETNGAFAVYIRFNPEITSGNAGFFKGKNTKTGEFEDYGTTDLTKYSPEDESVSWYYLPVNAGKATWIEPYSQENVEYTMISYVIPLYVDEQLIGIVGMDIDYEYVKEQIDSIHLYETGHAFLMDDDLNVLYSEHLEEGTSLKEMNTYIDHTDTQENTGMKMIYEHTVNGKRMRVTYQNLSNGMCLAVTAPASEIDYNKNMLTYKIVIVAVSIMFTFMLITWEITRSIVKPLKALNDAAKEIAEGNLDVKLDFKSEDEVGTLAESLKETARQLKIKINYINNLAYQDKLTGVKNNTAYMNEVSMVKAEMKRGHRTPVVFVVDVNGLKHINDNYGHEYGNELLISVAKVLGEVFGIQNVYRIGGDEFAVVFEQSSYEECQQFKNQFEQAIKEKEGIIKLSAAIGCAVYDPILDDSYDSIFRRADAEMYKRKQEMKQQGETSMVVNHEGEE